MDITHMRGARWMVPLTIFSVVRYYCDITFCSILRYEWLDPSIKKVYTCMQHHTHNIMLIQYEHTCRYMYIPTTHAGTHTDTNEVGPYRYNRLNGVVQYEHVCTCTIHVWALK